MPIARYSFVTLKHGYEHDLANYIPYRPQQASMVAKRLLRHKTRYVNMSSECGVPAVWLMAISERESGGKFTTYFGNGQPLHKRTTLVPKGRGPFRGLCAWENGVLDALQIMGMLGITDWTWPLMLFWGEKYNGFGPRKKGKKTGYLWAGSNLYSGGKYTETVRGSRWNSRMWDQQLGIVPVMKAIVKLAPELEWLKQ